MSYTCREFGSRVNVHELDHVPFCSLSAGFKGFQCILLLNCAFGGKATRLSDSLQAEQSHIYLWKHSLMCSSALRGRKEKYSLFFFSPQSYSSFVSAMPICHCSCQCDAFSSKHRDALAESAASSQGQEKGLCSER